MKKLTTIIHFIRNQHDVFYKVFLFAFSICTIVYFSPKEATFKYDFQKNKPWYHEDLLAPYNIPVQKSAVAIQQEEKNLALHKKLYFSYHDSISDQKVRSFKRLLNQKFTSYFELNQSKGLLNLFVDSKQKGAVLLKQLEQEGSAVLEKLYNKGIIQNRPEFEKFQDSSTFYVFKNKYYAAYSLGDVYTAKTAHKQLNQLLPIGKDNHNKFLLQLLEETLDQSPENIVFNQSQTEQTLLNAQKKIHHTIDEVIKGQSIIKKGDIVDAYKYRVLKSFEIKHKQQQLSAQKKVAITIGQTLLVSILITCLALYLIFFRAHLLENNKNIVFLLLVIVSAVVFTSIVLQQDYFSIYLVPLCLIPLIIRSFFDSRTAFFVLLIVSLLLGFILPNGLHFIFIQVVAGMVGLYGFVNFKNRSQLFITSAIILLSYCLCYFALNIVVEGDFDKIDWANFGWLGIAAFLTLLAYPVIYIFEKTFGFVSDVTLLELADTNNKLLRELSRKAPGTFQHSLQVANLAETAIFKIGGNSLLIRTAALYHDIGKMDAPMYFIENQATGVNPHDELAYDESAQIIINHVLKGIEIAKKNKLPDLIIDFIRTHHGTTKTEYFYRLHLEENPDETNFSDFTYPGPIPFSKESAVLMMADSVEAASRSIKQPNVEKIDALVEGVIAKQMNEQQFVNADITLRDISEIKKIFKKMLMNIYHVRVEYPH